MILKQKMLTGFEKNLKIKSVVTFNSFKIIFFNEASNFLEVKINY